MDAVTRAATRRVAGAVLLAMLVVTGCDSADPAPGGSTVDSTDQLRSRPSYEQGAAAYLAMLDEMKQAISRSAPDLAWDTSKSREKSWGLCAPPFEDVDGAESGTFDSGSATGRIPDAAWPAVRDAVVAIAARHGFTDVQTVKDEPGDKALVIKDGIGGSVELGTLVDTTLAVFGGCLLRSAPRPSATP